jgi:glycolate oxidase iron-sulfur subunit
MLVLEGCVQSAATPNTNAAARRVFDKLGISLFSAPRAGCCGALDHHLAAHAQGLDRMRRNIDAWWPHIENGVEAIVTSATGCGALLVDYGKLLAGDPAYSAKARRVSQLSRDLGEILLAEDPRRLRVNADRGKIAVHTPCTLRNALGRPDLLQRILTSAGFDIAATPGDTLCCGSAGTYSILQPATSLRLRESTLERLVDDRPDLIATANIGCQLHLRRGAEIPVVHWIELLDDGQAAPASAESGTPSRGS